MIVGELTGIISFFVSIIILVFSIRAMVVYDMIKHDVLVLFGIMIGLVVFILSSVWMVVFLRIDEFIKMVWTIEC